MEKINLPSHDWFKGSLVVDGRTNSFTGSLRTDQNGPVTSSSSLRYKVEVKKAEDDSLYLNVLSYMQGCYPDFRELLEETTRFDFTQEGITQAEDFLNKKYKQVCLEELSN